MRFYLGKRLSGGTWGGVSASPSDFERPVTRGIGRVIGCLFLTTVVAMVTGVGVGILTHNDMAVMGTAAAAPFLIMPLPWNQVRFLLRCLVLLLVGLFASGITWMIAAGH
jgi:hypothetical protein